MALERRGGGSTWNPGVQWEAFISFLYTCSDGFWGCLGRVDVLLYIPGLGDSGHVFLEFEGPFCCWSSVSRARKTKATGSWESPGFVHRLQAKKEES